MPAWLATAEAAVTPGTISYSMPAVRSADFLHQVAEQAGVATLQADDDAAGPRQLDQPAIDLVLRPEAAVPWIVLAGRVRGSMAAEANARIGRAGRKKPECGGLTR